MNNLYMNLKKSHGNGQAVVECGITCLSYPKSKIANQKLLAHLYAIIESNYNLIDESKEPIIKMREKVFDYFSKIFDTSLHEIRTRIRSLAPRTGPEQDNFQLLLTLNNEMLFEFLNRLYCCKSSSLFCEISPEGMPPHNIIAFKNIIENDYHSKEYIKLDYDKKIQFLIDLLFITDDNQLSCFQNYFQSLITLKSVLSELNNIILAKFHSKNKIFIFCQNISIISFLVCSSIALGGNLAMVKKFLRSFDENESGAKLISDFAKKVIKSKDHYVFHEFLYLLGKEYNTLSVKAVSDNLNSEVSKILKGMISNLR